MNSPAILFGIATAIWGSTWLAIKFQLGVVPPEASVAYRFALAALILAAGCYARGRSLSVPGAHACMDRCAGRNVFRAELRRRLCRRALRDVGTGGGRVLDDRVHDADRNADRVRHADRAAPGDRRDAGRGGCRAAVPAGASRGGRRRRRRARHRLCVRCDADRGRSATSSRCGCNATTFRCSPAPRGAWRTARSRAALVATLWGTEWTFDARLPYVVSLAYLALFGSIAAFGAYFLLLKRVGAGPASFVGVSTPVLAMLLSTLFEGYRWTWVALVGVVLAIAGNLLALRATPSTGTEPKTRDAARVVAQWRLLQRQPCFDDELPPAREIALDHRAETLGGPDTSSAPSRSSRARTSGCASSFCTSPLIFATISRGVPTGATMPQ